MKAIIIAAGRGKRMEEMTDDKPKCLLEFNGVKLLDIQLEALRANGIKDVSIITGYKREKIRYPGLKYYVNERYKHNNILHSLFYAEDEMDGDFIATYSDIIFDKSVVGALMESTADISIVVDIDWRKSYKGRHGHPIGEAENVFFNLHKNVVSIGKMMQNKDKAQGEFIGMLKCSTRGAVIFREHFKKLKKNYTGKPFQATKVFENAYITDMVQDLVDSGIRVHCVNIRGGWMEIDVVDDYKKATRKLRVRRETVKAHDNQA